MFKSSSLWWCAFQLLWNLWKLFYLLQSFCTVHGYYIYVKNLLILNHRICMRDGVPLITLTLLINCKRYRYGNNMCIRLIGGIVHWYNSWQLESFCGTEDVESAGADKRNVSNPPGVRDDRSRDFWTRLVLQRSQNFSNGWPKFDENSILIVDTIFSTVIYTTKVKPNGFCEKKFLVMILTTKVYSYFFS